MDQQAAGKILSIRRRAYTGTRKIAGVIGLRDAWARAADRYVWGRASVDVPDGKRLFQVVGVARSGTTLLANLVAAHRDAYCIVEPYRGFYVHGRCADGDELVDGHPNEVVSTIVCRRPESCIGIKETFYSSDYDPDYRNQELFERLKELGALTLVIHRDPRDIYASVKEFAHHSGSVLPKFMDNWREFVSWSAKNADLAVTYESLVFEPDRTMSMVLTTLGLSSESYEATPVPLTGAAILGVGDPKALESRSVDRSSVGSYAMRLSAGTVEFIERTCGREMEELGYQP